jgi:hypothetical protein
MIMENESEITKAKAHTHKLFLNQHAHKLVHGQSRIGLLNTRLAVKITKAVGSMWCAYAFALIALVSLPAAIMSHNMIIIVSWIAQTFFQLVLLPVILVGQNVQAAASDAQAQNDHETLVAIHTLSSEIHRINEQQTIILNLLKEKANNPNTDDNASSKI